MENDNEKIEFSFKKFLISALVVTGMEVALLDKFEWWQVAVPIVVGLLGGMSSNFDDIYLPPPWRG